MLPIAGSCYTFPETPSQMPQRNSKSTGVGPALPLMPCLEDTEKVNFLYSTETRILDSFEQQKPVEQFTFNFHVDKTRVLPTSA